VQSGNQHWRWKQILQCTYRAVMCIIETSRIYTHIASRVSQHCDSLLKIK
jgi:hypothetical protein